MKLRSRFAFPARDSGARLPALLALVLAASALLQLLLPGAPLPDGGGVVARIGGGRATGNPLPVNPAAFLAARSPFAPVIAAPGAGGASDALSGAVVAGMVQVGAVRYAIVQDPNGTIRRVAPGGTVAGWRIAMLGPSGVRLVRGGESLALGYGERASMRAEDGATNPEEGEQ